MNKLLLFVVLFLCADFAHAQGSISDAALPDGPSAKLAASARPGNDASERQVTWSSLPKDFLHDQKGIWLFPLQLGKGHYWLPTLAVVGGTAGVVETQPHATGFFCTHPPNLAKP